jgi:hypothetical protein
MSLSGIYFTYATSGKLSLLPSSVIGVHYLGTFLLLLGVNISWDIEIEPRAFLGTILVRHFDGLLIRLLPLYSYQNCPGFDFSCLP